MAKRILITAAALAAFAVLAAGSGTTAPGAPGAPGTPGTSPPAVSASAPTTGLGSAAQPRSCDMRAASGKCRQMLPAYYGPPFNISEQMARETCTGPGGTYATAPCATDTVVGHCITDREDVFYYASQYTASTAPAECSIFEHGTYTATP